MNTGNLSVWRTLYQPVGDTFRRPLKSTSDPAAPVYVTGWNGKSSGRFSFHKLQRLVDLFRFDGKISTGSGTVDVWFRIQASHLGTLANIPYRDIEGNDPEFAERYGAQWGFPGEFLRYENEVIILAPMRTGPTIPLLHFRAKDFFVRDMTRLIRFGCTDKESKSEPTAVEG